MDKTQSNQMFSKFIKFVKELYKNDYVPLHTPVFAGNEKKYLNECIDTTFVSYVGRFVNLFEERIAAYTGAKYTVAIVNGTCALEIALKVCGLKSGDEVLTQALTFVATSNAIAYCGGRNIFIDSERINLGMCPEKLEDFLKQNAEIRSDGFSYNKNTNNRIYACVPVHVFGHPCLIDKIIGICKRYNIVVVEDAAESFGSKYFDKHTGTFGKTAILSFNGNKTITTGGGGMIITDDEQLAKKAKHITTTAKVAHPYNFFHDELGYNYRMTNVNAAIGCAQIEKIDEYIANKRENSALYKYFFATSEIDFFTEKESCFSNYWLNVIFLKDRYERDAFLKYTNDNGVMTRPAWTLMNKLPMYKNCLHTNLDNAQWLEDRLVNIPSSVRM
jgi:perosamine synthetase